MAAGYEVQARLAAEAGRRGDALAATIRWCLAADAAGTDMERVRALGAALRGADLALHQAVYAARDPDWRRRDRLTLPGEQYEPPSWRALASAAGVPVSTLNRRYRRRPARTAPEPVALEEGDLERLMDPADWMEDEDDAEPVEADWPDEDDWPAG